MPWMAKPLSQFSRISLMPTNVSSISTKRTGKASPGKPSAAQQPALAGPDEAHSIGRGKGKARIIGRPTSAWPPAMPTPTAPQAGATPANGPAPTGPATPPTASPGVPATTGNTDAGVGADDSAAPPNSDAVNEEAGANASSGNPGNLSAGGSNSASANAGNGNAGNGNSGKSNTGNGNSGNSNGSAGSGSASNGNVSNASASNGNASNGSASNGSASNGNAGIGNSGSTPAPVAPGMSVVTWMPPGLVRKETGGLAPGLASRLTDDLGLQALASRLTDDLGLPLGFADPLMDDFGLSPGVQQVLERRPVVLSREQSTLAPQENPRAALRLQMHRAAARYAAMSVSTQFATTQNEQAINAARSGPARIQIFFGWLRIK